MFVSFKIISRNTFLIILCAIVVLSSAFIVSSISKDSRRVSGEVYSDVDSVCSYINSFGLEVDKLQVVQDEIIVPELFNEVYENYNNIQISQGFDLTKYKGLVLKRYTFPVTNYPEKQQNVFVEILLYQNSIVAADIYSTNAQGFIKALK